MSDIAELALMVGPLDDNDRRAFIEEFLTWRGLDYRVEVYDPLEAMESERSARFRASRDLPDIKQVWFDEGKNIVLDPSPGSQGYLFCAHYDSAKTFDDGKREAGMRPHYNDNASSVAALLALTDDLHKGRLSHSSRVSIAFFDDEEIGRLGSTAYLLQNPERRELEGIFNFEMLAFGTYLAVAKTACGEYQASGHILEVARIAARKAGVALIEEDSPGSDHLTFLKAGNPNATVFWSTGAGKKPNSPESINKETLESGYALMRNLYQYVTQENRR